MTSDAVAHRPDLVVAVHDGETLSADAWLPVGAARPPALILLHGGAWTKGSRHAYAEWGRYLAGRGIAAVAIDYRLATPGRSAFPESLWDVKGAIQALRAGHLGFEVDGNRIGMLGGSAGAHLAALAALTAGDPVWRNPYPDPFADVSAAAPVVIGLAGTYDMIERWVHDRLDRTPDDSSAELLLGGTPMSQRRRYYEASPVFHASEANARGTRWLLAWGTEDDVTPPETQSLALSRHLKLAGAVVRHAPIVGAPHYWYFETEPDAPGSFNARFAERLHVFLERWAGW